MTRSVQSDVVPTVLVVDDHPANLLALEAALEPLNYRVVPASSGKHALKLLGEHDFVLIVMDVNMPGLDGYQTVARPPPRQRNSSRKLVAREVQDVLDHALHATTQLRLCGAPHSRKNYLFVGDVAAGKSLAGLYSLVATCEARGINPFDYLVDVLARVASAIDELLPGAWAAAD
jgi:Response regulator receiver domain/IS66 C-terminal element